MYGLQDSGPLEGKRALVMGLANDKSLAWGITQALHQAGATLGFSYPAGPIEKRMRPLAESVKAAFVEPCDVGDDEQIAALFAKVGEHFGTIDILVHAIAFARQEAFKGRFVETTREDFRIAQDVSAYSLLGVARAALPLMPNGGSILTLTYYGAEKVVPKYKVMGVAKAALEATVRYLAEDLGPQGIRVNAISSGPIQTLSSSGIKGFRGMLSTLNAASPLRTGITIQDIGEAALFLCGPSGRVITGEVLHVDAGFNILGMQQAEEGE